MYSKYKYAFYLSKKRYFWWHLLLLWSFKWKPSLNFFLQWNAMAIITTKIIPLLWLSRHILRQLHHFYNHLMSALNNITHVIYKDLLCYNAETATQRKSHLNTMTMVLNSNYQYLFVCWKAWAPLLKISFLLKWEIQKPNLFFLLKFKFLKH